MKENNFNFNQVFLNTLDSLTSSGTSPALKGLQIEDLHPEGSALEQLFSFLHLNNVSANISEKSLSILLSKASFAFLLISMLFYWFQMSFKSQIVMNKLTPQSPTADPEGVSTGSGHTLHSHTSSEADPVLTPSGSAVGDWGVKVVQRRRFVKKADASLMRVEGYGNLSEEPTQIPHTQAPDGVREAQGYSVTPEKFSIYKGRAQYGISSVTGKKSTLAIILEKIPFISMWSANITLVLLLSIRWVESGHFPLSNLYESLIFLSWSLTVIHLFLENLFHKNSPNRLGPKQILLAEGDWATYAPSLLGIPRITANAALETGSATQTTPFNAYPSGLPCEAQGQLVTERLQVANPLQVAELTPSGLRLEDLSEDLSGVFPHIPFPHTQAPKGVNTQAPAGVREAQGLRLEDLYPEGYASDPILTLGAITSPIALFTNAFATFSLPQEMQKVTVLVPALKSNWLIMHVSVMIISYAALLSGSLLAMAFLVIKFIDELRINKHSLPHTNRRFSLRVGGSGEVPEAFQRHSEGVMLTNGVVQIKDLSELWQRIVLTNKEALNPLQVASPHTSFSSKLRLENLSEDLSKIVLTTKSKAEESQPLLLTQRLTNQKSDVNREGTLFGTIAGLPPTRLLTENKMLMNLPQILDNLSYRSIGLGFALLTIGILSGAVWANEAWGSYWSWDPKETWALITWLVFALYLHTRLSKGWVGKESAFVASFGFIVIWFCYLGVNLFGKGLHSYGWFQQ